jgi:Kef-type K+ transport system membrane component KefB
VLRIGLLVTLIQGLLCIPQAAHLLFGRLIGLPPLSKPAVMTLLATVPLEFLFFARIPFQVAMYNARAPLGVVCLSFPVGLEVAASAWKRYFFQPSPVHRRHRAVLRKSGIHSNASAPSSVDRKGLTA